jgi:hypothetical protein
MPAEYVTIDAEFEMGVDLDNLRWCLNSQATNTAATPCGIFFNPVEIDTADTSASGVWATINSIVKESGKYVILDLSACTAKHGSTPNTIEGKDFSPSQNNFNIIQDNQFIKGVVLPSTLTSIGNDAFDGCCDIVSVSLPDGLTSIGAGAFSNCTLLASISIPSDVTSLGFGAFSSCHALSSVTILSGNITTIEDTTFRNCISLGSITIPSGVTSIGQHAFAACVGLTHISIPGSVASLGIQAFAECSKLVSVTFGTGSNIVSEWRDDTFGVPSQFYDRGWHLTTFETGASLWAAYTGTPTKAGNYTLDLTLDDQVIEDDYYYNYDYGVITAASWSKD